MAGQNSSYVKKIAVLSVMLAAAVILGYVESLIPFNFGVPGIKLGLANIVSLMIIYMYKTREAYMVGILRVLIIGFLFGNLSMIIYSLSGLILSITMMFLFVKSHKFSIIGISVIGAIGHNVGQLLVAYLVVRTSAIIYYLPFLLVAAVVTGVCTGIIATGILRVLKYKFEREMN